MDLRRVETKPAEKLRPRRPSPSTMRLETPQTEASLQWVTARVPPELVREIEAHAKRSGTTRSEAIRECLAVGSETIRHREGVPGGRVDLAFVVLAGCGPNTVELGPRLRGRVLSVMDRSDRPDVSCESTFAAAPRLRGRKQVVTDLGLGHGLVYNPLPEWLDPLGEWAAPTDRTRP